MSEHDTKPAPDDLAALVHAYALATAQARDAHTKTMAAQDELQRTRQIQKEARERLWACLKAKDLVKGNGGPNADNQLLEAFALVATSDQPRRPDTPPMAPPDRPAT